MRNKNGTIRAERKLKNLLDNPFQLDQRSYWDQLWYIKSYLNYINYFDINNEMAGKWSLLVEGDPIIYMAAIVNDPVSDLKIKLASYDSKKATKSEKIERVNELLQWFDKIEKWQENLSHLGEEKLTVQLKGVSKDILRPQKVVLEDVLDALKKGDPITLKLRFRQSEIIDLTDEKDKDDVISNVINIFIKVIARIQSTTKKYLQENLLSRSDHQPHNALYIAFALLYKSIQDDLNKLSKKHLDFYYKNILHQQPREAEQVRAIVNFELLPDVKQTYIEKGTKLSAGKQFGSDTDVLFETTKALVAHQVSIVEMQTLFFNYNKYIDIGTDQTAIYSVEKNHLISGGKEVTGRDEWFLFGANKQSVQNTRIKSEERAELGFIIGSPVLLLSEGIREIELKIELDPETSKQKLWKLLHEIKDKRNCSMNTAFDKVFFEGFTISYTSKEGWLNFENYRTTYSEEDNSITIHLVIQEFEPPLEKSKKISESLKWPAVKVLLNDLAPVYLYSFLRGVEVNAIAIDVSVENLRNVSVYNNVGKMSLDKPFEVFGPVSPKGSYLIIGKSELFQKNITALDIQLDWDDLPSRMGGFETYYQAYSDDIKNDTFKVAFSILNRGYWSPADMDKAAVCNLFNTENALSPEGYEGVKLMKSSIFNIREFEDYDIRQDYDLVDPLSYSMHSQSGFVKITLCNPDIGFGSDVYQQEFTEIATYNAKNKRQIPYPNKSFIPKLKGVSVRYKASDRLLIKDSFAKTTKNGTNEGEFFHIRIEGTDDVLVNGKVKQFNLLSDFEFEGSFYLALSGITEVMNLSIYFDLLRSSSTKNIEESKLTWQYYELGKWVSFHRENLLKDDTYGFLKSGVVELRMPNIENSIGDTGEQLLWIRVYTENHVEDYPKIKGVYLNAIETICTIEDPLIKGVKLPAGTITKIEGNFPDIKSINQASPSYAGKPMEAEETMYTRVSERLRHKSRAVTLWDYERLVLERIDTVRIAKCTNYNEKFEAIPGQITMAVLSTRWTNNERNYFKQNTLKFIKEFLERHANPFVTIKVINPIPEYLLVNCTVVFNDENAGGNLIKKLNEDISNCLSPVSHSSTGLRGIGGAVFPDFVKSYVEKLSYVATVKHLKIEHIIELQNYEFDFHIHKSRRTVMVPKDDGKMNIEDKKQEPIEAMTPWSVLIPMKQHRITVQSDKSSDADPQAESAQFGVGDMEIGIDFILEGGQAD